MKERLLDVIKWGLILITAGVVFYVVSPKYEFKRSGGLYYRHNKITGQIDFWVPGDDWKRIQKKEKT